MLISGTERRAIPHEPDEWMELKRLNAKKLGKAREAKTMAAVAMMRGLGSEFMAQAREAAAETATQRSQASDPLDNYDTWKLCEYGIKDWSYDAEVTIANIEDLDEKTLHWTAREILRLSGVEADPIEAAKNGYSPSIVGLPA